MKKTDVHIFVWRAARHTMCTSIFSFILQGNENNQQSILKCMTFHKLTFNGFKVTELTRFCHRN